MKDFSKIIIIMEKELYLMKKGTLNMKDILKTDNMMELGFNIGKMEKLLQK